MLFTSCLYASHSVQDMSKYRSPSTWRHTSSTRENSRYLEVDGLRVKYIGGLLLLQVFKDLSCKYVKLQHTKIYQT